MKPLLQTGLFEGPPAVRIANPAPRIDPPARPPVAPQVSFGRLYRDWNNALGDVQAVDIRARWQRADDSMADCTVGRLLRAADVEDDDEWLVWTDDEEWEHILPVFDACGPHLREAKQRVRAWVAAWADNHTQGER